mgnify:CR=1 FL=1
MSVSVKNACKPLLAELDRKDLLRFVRKEIVDLKADDKVNEITAELVIKNLMERYPENTYTPPPKKEIKWTKNEQRYVGQHPLQ